MIGTGSDGPATPAFDTTDEFLAIDAGSFTAPMADALVRFEVTDRVKRRIEVLAEKSNFGTLSEAERDEYLRWINLSEVLSICQAKARGFLSHRD